jgi:hypothetical protein
MVRIASYACVVLRVTNHFTGSPHFSSLVLSWFPSVFLALVLAFRLLHTDMPATQVVGMGFDAETAKSALKMQSWDEQAAINALLL